MQSQPSRDSGADELEFFRLGFAHLQDAFSVWDRDLRLRFASPNLAGLLALPDGHLTPGCSFREIIRLQLMRGDFGPPPEIPADCDALIEDRAQAVLQAQAGRKFVRRTARGTWIQTTSSRLKAGEFIVVYRDITEVRDREDQLEAQRLDQQLVLDELTDGVALYSPDLRLLLANRELQVLSGSPADDMRPGTALADIVRTQVLRGDFGSVPSSREEIDALVSERIARVTAPEFVRFARRSPGGYWLEYNFRRLRSGHLFCHYRDITELKERETELAAARDEAENARRNAETADRAKSSFLATMSHEIRTPMNGVVGMLEVLEQTPLTDDQRRHTDLIRGSADALLKIIDDVLDFSKIEANKLEIEQVPFSLREVIEGSVLSLAYEARRKGLKLIVLPASTSMDLVIGDPTRLRQILLNLVGNAIKFTSTGEVRVAYGAEPSADEVVVTIQVEDTGIGLSEDRLGRLFQPFSQADSSTTRRFGGSGLGLAIVRRLSELMSGKVSVTSTPGQGTKFQVQLLLKRDPENTYQASQASQSTQAQDQNAAPTVTVPKTILVIDDHELNRQVIGHQLGLIGLRAEIAEGGLEGLDAWRHRRHDVVLLDLHMPDLDGFDVARAIRSDERSGGSTRTALIALTASAMKGEAERCFEAGMDDFLVKPVRLEELRRTLVAHLLNPKAHTESGPPLEPAVIFEPKVLRGIFEDAPERVAPLLDRFIRSAQQDVRDILERFRSRDLERAAASSHRLYGSARLAGAMRLAEVARSLEVAAKTGDMITIQRTTPDLTDILEATLSLVRDSVKLGF